MECRHHNILQLDLCHLFQKLQKCKPFCLFRLSLKFGFKVKLVGAMNSRLPLSFKHFNDSIRYRFKSEPFFVFLNKSNWVSNNQIKFFMIYD
jgi:hypothetical protein